MTRPLFLFTPGAGAPSSHPWMQRWKARLSALGDVAMFDYPYMQERRKRPDPLPQLIASHRQALIDWRPPSDQPAFLIGKSMGGRVGCHVALEESVAGVICFGYPLCGGGDPARLRDKVLRELRTPVLFCARNARSALSLGPSAKHHWRNAGGAFPPCRRRRGPFAASSPARAEAGGRDAGGSRSANARRYRPVCRAFL